MRRAIALKHFPDGTVLLRQAAIRLSRGAIRRKTFVEPKRETATRHAWRCANKVNPPTKGRSRRARSTSRWRDDAHRHRKIVTRAQAESPRLKIRRLVRPKLSARDAESS